MTLGSIYALVTDESRNQQKVISKKNLGPNCLRIDGCSTASKFRPADFCR